MKEFELSQTKKDRKKELKKYKKAGFKKWQAKYFLEQRPHTFGLKNNIKTLTEKESEQLQTLSDKRDELIEEYKKLSTQIQPLLEQLQPLLEKENQVWDNLEQINQDICQIEGHRLSEKVEITKDSDGYGGNLYFKYRKCLICDERIYETNISKDDVVVKGESDNPKRLTRR